MRDYWLTQYILSAIGWGYLIVVLIVLALVIWLVKSKTAKTISLVVVIGLASVLPFQGYQEYAKEKVAEDAYRVRLTKAQALFDERCKTAGEKIYKTVDDVDNVRLLNVRPEQIDTTGQFALDDQYGHDLGGIRYIASFLRPTENTELSRGLQHLNMPGYRFVVIPDGNGVRRYSKSFKLHPNGDPYPSTQETASFTNVTTRYAVQYEDLSTTKDRENWIAGGSIKIVDTASNEVIAERKGYLFDTGLGNTNGGRTPWSWARQYVPTCPSVAEHNQIFVFKVLKPKQGE